MKDSKNLTIVIKLGTSSIVHEISHEPRLSTISVIVETAVKLRRDGHRVVLVSSGAIGVALQMMNLETRPKHLPRVQALAALGQCRLMSLWDRFFMHLRQPVAQILLTRNDIADRTQYLNAQNTFSELLDMGIIPIVNENDTLSVAEIKFGDNDTLSAITAAMVQADYLFLMTDVDCLYTANPRTNPSAIPIEVVPDITSLQADVSSAGSSLGTGGMSTKIVAARLATSAGVTTVITRSSKPGNVADIVDYVERLKLSDPSGTSPPPSTNAQASAPPLHTRFLPSSSPITSRSFWLLHGLAPHGTIYIDEGAYRALQRKAGLLPAGIVDVEGSFSQQEAVRLVVVKGKQARAALQPSSNTNTPTRSSRPASESSSATPFAFQPPLRPRSLRTVGLSVSEHNASPTADPLFSSFPPYAASASSSSLASGNATPSSSGAATGLYEALDPPPREVGRALVNYAAGEVARIKGLQSSDIADVLGYADSEYVALRENVSLVRVEGSGEPGGGAATGDGRAEAAEGGRAGQRIGKIGDLASFA